MRLYSRRVGVGGHIFQPRPGARRSWPLRERDALLPARLAASHSATLFSRLYQSGFVLVLPDCSVSGSLRCSAALASVAARCSAFLNGLVLTALCWPVSAATLAFCLKPSFSRMGERSLCRPCSPDEVWSYALQQVLQIATIPLLLQSGFGSKLLACPSRGRRRTSVALTVAGCSAFVCGLFRPALWGLVLATFLKSCTQPSCRRRRVAMLSLSPPDAFPACVAVGGRHL